VQGYVLALVEYHRPLPRCTPLISRSIT
jgi:hypothetical protein